MAANTTAINLQTIPSYSVARPSIPQAAVKMALAFVVGGLTMIATLEALAVSQSVLQPVFNGTMVLLSRPAFPVGF